MTPGTIIAAGYPLIDSERQSLAKRIDAIAAERDALRQEIDGMCKAFGFERQEDENARLRAEIALLVEALENLLSATDSLDWHDQRVHSEEIAAARAAIAKAKQEPQTADEIVPGAVPVTAELVERLQKLTEGTEIDRENDRIEGDVGLGVKSPDWRVKQALIEAAIAKAKQDQQP